MFRPTMAPEEKPLPAETITQTEAAGESVLVFPKPDAVALKERDSKRYEFIGEHARGGLGRVMRTRDMDLGREVAIKEMLSPGGVGEARFVREAMITARLEHPGIVPVHDAGRWPDGTPFYAMKLVSGRPLKELLQDAKTVEARLSLVPHVIAVAEAIAYAHDRHIIHRDIKPSNIIVGRFGETVVIDWGLAKDMRSADPAPDIFGPYRQPLSSELTQTGAVIGTPAYMPPEQARGAEVDERADVYSLGAVIYHVLSGVPPYEGADTAKILSAVASHGPVPLPSLAPHAPKDLLAIVAKAMKRDVEQRYTTAKELAEDLARFHTGQLVRAHEYTSAALFKRWFRRNRRIAAVTLASVVTIAAISTVAVRNVVRARNRASSLQLQAEERARALQTSMAQLAARANALLLSEASHAVDEDPSSAINILSSYPIDGADWPKARDLAIKALANGLPSALIRVSAPQQAGMALSPNQRTLAVIDHGSVFVLDRTHDIVTKTWPLPVGPLDKVIFAQWLSDATLVVALHQGTVAIFESSRSPVILHPQHGELEDVAVDSSGRYIAAGCRDGAVWVYDVVATRGRAVLQHEGTANDVAFHGATLLSIGSDGLLQGVDMKANLEFAPRLAVRVSRASLSALALEPGVTSQLALGSDDGSVFLVDSLTLRHVKQIAKFESRVMQLEWLHGTSSLIVATSDFAISRLSSVSHDSVLLGRGAAFAQSSDGMRLVAAGTTGLLALYNPFSLWHRSIKAHPSPITSILVDKAGGVTTIGEDGTLRQWDGSIWPKHVYTYEGASAYVDTFPGRESFVIASDMGQVSLCHLDGTCRRTQLRRRGPVLVRLQGPTEPIVVADLAGGTVYVLDDSLEELGHYTVEGGLRDVRVSHGRLAALTSRGSVEVGEISEFNRHPVTECANVSRIRWLSDGQLLVGCADGSLIVDSLSSSGSKRTAIRDATSFDGIGGFGDETLLALVDHSVIYRVAPAESSPWIRCATTTSMLYEALDGGMFVADCGTVVRAINENAWTESPSLSMGVIADLDADRATQTVAIGMSQGLVIWKYAKQVLTPIGSDAATYNVELSANGGDVIALSGAGSAQLWDIEALAGAPTEFGALHAWLVSAAMRIEVNRDMLIQ